MSLSGAVITRFYILYKHYIKNVFLVFNVDYLMKYSVNKNNAVGS